MGEVTRREAMKAALKAGAYATPVVLSATVPQMVSAATPPLSADLTITKAVDIPAPAVGANVTFTLVVNNRGPAVATGVVVTDLLPAGLTFVSSSTLQGSYSAATGLWTIGTLAIGARAMLTLVATAAIVGVTVNTATVRADQGDPDLSNNSAMVRVTVGAVPAADLGLTKTVDNATPNIGDVVTFTLTLTNAGPSAASGVQVTDVLPVGLTFLSATPSGAYVSATGVWTVGTLANGATTTLAIRATVASAGAKTNTATISASALPDPVTTNNTASATVTPQQADLGLTKTVDKLAPDLFSTVVFTLTLTNNGPNSATGVTVTDALPAGVIFVSSMPSQGSYNAVTGLWTVGAMANGATATLKITVTVGVAALPSATNTANVSHSDQIDPVPGNNSASATVNPRSADIEVTKALGNEAPVRGETLTYQVSVRNIGPNDATGVAVTDPIPANLGGGAVTVVDQGTYSSVTGIWSIGSLSAGGASVSLFLQGSYDGPITNTATRTASNPPDPNTSNDSQTVTLPTP